MYEHYLIDVEMGSSGTTSRIQEAIAATQLFFHRYFVNLEDVQLRGSDQQALRRDLKAWWKWMKNYRVWEANRKVFLYPENYIEPDLRTTKQLSSRNSKRSSSNRRSTPRLFWTPMPHT